MWGRAWCGRRWADVVLARVTIDREALSATEAMVGAVAVVAQGGSRARRARFLERPRDYCRCRWTHYCGRDCWGRRKRAATVVAAARGGRSGVPVVAAALGQFLDSEGGGGGVGRSGTNDDTGVDSRLMA